MKDTLGCCLAIAIALTLLSQTTLPTAVTAQESELFRYWNRPVEPFQLIGNIYYVGAGDITSFLITTPDGHILIDSGFEETVPLIRKNLKALGFAMEDVKVLLNSHAHKDHAGGMAQLKKLTGAQLVASEDGARLLSNGGKNDYQLGDTWTYPCVETDRVISDGEDVTLGGVTMSARLTPGHTKGCTTWTTKVAVNGEILHVVFVGSITIAREVRLLNNPQYVDIVDDYVKTLETLEALPCDVFLGAHGSFFNLEEKAERLRENTHPNPFVDPAGYAGYVERAKQRYREKVKREQTLMRMDG